jgi:hypothetical protein
MKKYLILTLGIAVLVVAAASQETSAPQHKPKPSAARIAAPERSATPASAPAQTTSPTYSTTTAAEPAASSQTYSAPAVTAPEQDSPQREMPAPALAQRAQTAPPADDYILPVGTTLRMKLQSAISTSTNKVGDTFTANVTQPVMVGGRTMIPMGASVQGRIIQLTEPRRIRGVPIIDLKPETVIMPSGESYSFSAVVVDTTDPKHHDVDEEGRIKGQGHNAADLRNLIVGAGVGGVVGAVLEQTKRATLIGAGIGTTAMLVHWLIKRRTEQLPAGTELYVELSRPMTMTTAMARR